MANHLHVFALKRTVLRNISDAIYAKLASPVFGVIAMSFFRISAV
jgi:hypothetical protein